MEEKNRFDDTISGMSLQDILDEIKLDSYDSDEDVNIDEILAEFSDAPKKKKRKKIEVKIPELPIIEEEKKVSDEKPETEEPKEIVKEPDPPVEEKRDDKEPRLIETVVHPWENGVYGDMDLSDTIDNRKKKKKKTKLSETLDTFTRSDLFEDKNKDVLPEMRTVEQIMQENNRVSKFLGLRVILLFVLSVLSCYLAFAEPLSWLLPRAVSYLSHPFRYLFITVFFEIMAMLLSIDVISRGIYRIFRLRPDVDSAIAFSAISTLVHAVTIMAAPQWRGWLPYSCISVLCMFFVILGKWINARALRRICKTVKSAKLPNVVYVEKNYGETSIIKQETGDTSSFIAHINDKDASTTFWTYLSPVVIIASLVLAVVASVGTRTPQHFFWALAAISCVSAPLFTALSFTFPFSVTAKNLSTVGTALSGWYSLSSLSRCGSVVVRDGDLFPKGCITLNGLKILGNFSLEQTVCYVASVIGETKSGLSEVFSDLLKSRYGTTMKVSNLRYHESGGVEAEIAGDSVLVGTAGFMLRSGIRLASGAKTKNAVFVAINRQPAGVFNINYKANAEVERALHMLVKKRVPVVLAVRDFNLLPMMVEQTFGLKDGSLEYPEIEQRIDMSNEEQFVSSDISAVITRSGLYPFAAAILAAKKLRRATIRNVFMTTASAIIGMLLMFYLTFMQRPVLITPHTVFIYMLLWFLPMYMLSLRVKK
ncbi:MAG: hypothetical protein IKU65_01100 [Oscillospiraceae bacterium]|nr:hypothetical protein [Oscillospiraceae bacterium]